MIKTRLVVAALLLTNVWTAPVAAQEPEHDPFHAPSPVMSKKAQKIVALLDYAGLADPKITRFVSDVDARIDDGYLRLAEERYESGTLRLHYQLEGVSLKNLQLQYKPNDSHFEYVAQPNQAMVRYQLRF